MTTPHTDPSDRPLLTRPADGVPDVMTHREELHSYIERVRRGKGPFAVDTERASGYRYGQNAYLVQVRREGAGTALIDPVALPDLSALAEATQDVTWVLHAASQDLPCLKPLGMVPARLYDTEVAARLLGDPKVSLGAVVERELGIRLKKEHSAVDWSKRPLPEDWRAYAALDVELLADVMDRQVARLREDGKLAWAEEEFDYIRTAPPRPAKPEPWRRTTKISEVRSPRGLAQVREIWRERDAVGRETNTCPSRILPDRVMIHLVTAQPSTELQIKKVRGMRHREYAGRWLAALNRGRNLPREQWPSTRGAPRSGLPDHRRWAHNHPEAHRRLLAVRRVVAQVGEAHNVPAETMLLPAHQRLLAWVEFPPTPAGVRAALDEMGARSWQIGLLAAPLAQALAEA